MKNHFLTQQALKAASVQGLFTPDDLCRSMNLSADDLARRDVVWRLLSTVCDEKIFDDRSYYWLLDPDQRRATLRQFYSRESLQDFIAQVSLEGQKNIEDPFSVGLKDLLTGARICFKDPGVSAELKQFNTALKRAAALLDAAEFAKDIPALAQHTYQVRASDRQTYQPMSILELRQFADARIKDLQARSDLRIVVPNSHFGYGPQREKISQFARGIGETKPLLLTGIGGAGKSAILSRLMLGWQRTEADLIQVLLDFDRRQLSMGEPIEILQEFFRQIIAFLQLHKQGHAADLVTKLQQLRRDVALFKIGTDGKRASNSIQMSYALRVIGELGHDWAKPLADMRMVIILDTFEAIDRMAVSNREFDGAPNENNTGNEVVLQIMEMLRSIQQDYLPKMRVIVSGREKPLGEADLKAWFGQHVHLKGLHPISGAKLLRSELERLEADRLVILQDDETARRICKLLGGHPLAIIAFAKYANGNPRDVDGLIAELEADGGFAAEFAQVFLYTRILNRITDPQVRPVAHPGLMLRSINAEMILDVLAGPCLDRGPTSETPLTETEAKDLFLRLRNQYWLVNPVQGDATTVRHIPDLRRLMLPGLLAGPREDDNEFDRARKLDLQTRALKVCANAAHYFQQRDTQEDALNALYYGAFNSAPPQPFTEELARDLDRHLVEDVDTMPVAWRAVIKHLMGRELSTPETEALPDQYRDAQSRRQMKKIQQTGTRIYSKDATPKSPAKGPTSINVTVSFGETPLQFENDTTSERAREEWQSQSIIQQSYAIRSLWAEPDSTLELKASWFLEKFLNTALSQGVSEDMWSIEEDARNEPFDNALYVAALLCLATDKNRTIQVAPDDPLPGDFTAITLSLLDAMSGHLYDPLPAAAKALPRYLSEVERFSPIAANRLHAADVLSYAFGNFEKLDRNFELQLAGLCLAAGNEINGKEAMASKGASGPLFQQSLFPFWQERDMEDLTLAKLERYYRLREHLPLEHGEFQRMTSNQKAYFMSVVRGLTPELYPPTISLLSDLETHIAEGIVFEATREAALWPVELQFDEQNYYQARDASVVVETADQCGVLRNLLVKLSSHAPFADRLTWIFDLITTIHYPEAAEFLINAPDEMRS